MCVAVIDVIVIWPVYCSVQCVIPSDSDPDLLRTNPPSQSIKCQRDRLINNTFDNRIPELGKS